MITQDTNIVAILEISGIQFTSRQFSIEIEMKQIMIVNDLYEEDVCFNKCVIKPRGVLLSSKDDYIKKEEPVTLSVTDLSQAIDEGTCEKKVDNLLFIDLDKLKKKGCWGMFHELGHNMQRSEWTFSGSGEVTVNFVKKDGSARTMICTLSESKIPTDFAPKGSTKVQSDEALAVFDVEANGWRSFRYDSITQIQAELTGK
jgi:hypothetical protein